MNGIIALGDRALTHVATTYHDRNPSAIYVLGARNSTDVRLHSLEDLLEPFMDGYFDGEAELRTRVALDALRLNADICGPLEFGEVVTAADTVLQRSLASCLSLVEMLDRANKLHPIELVVVGEHAAPLPATAVAWARTRGITSVLFDAATLHEVAKPPTDRVVAFGPRARTAYRSIGVDDPQLAVLAHPKYSTMGTIARNRAGYRGRVLEVQGWPQSDCLVSFEPEGLQSEYAGDDLRTFDTSVREMFAAYTFARERVPGLRLAVLPSRPVPDGMVRTTAIAIDYGVSASDIVYAETDGDIWTGIADIMVSCDSARSIEGAVAGIPAINLWRPENWYAGPAFGAEDGIIDVQSEMLGPTLVALANDRGVRGQIAAIAQERAASFGMEAADRIGSDTAVRAAELLMSLRPPGAPAVHVKEKLDIVILGPPYTHASAGIRALYRLCHFINLLGGNASMFPGVGTHPTWNTPRRVKNLTERSIVVYPETTDRPLPAQRVVRWVLNVPGLLAGPTHYEDGEMIFYHTGLREAAQRATTEFLTEERELALSTIEPDLFYYDRSTPRLYDCVYIGKGEELYRRLRPPEIANAFVIRRHENAWPKNRAETSAMLRGCKRLYCYDPNTAIYEEALLCGVIIVLVGPNGELTESGGPPSGTAQTAQDVLHNERFAARAKRYLERYYDTSHVERFLRLVDERWG